MRKILFAFFLRYYFQRAINVGLGHLLRYTSGRVRRVNWDFFEKNLPDSETWVVVGNGPSLTVEQLESLSYFPSIASNKISLLFDKTEWRPTVFSIADPLLIFKLEPDDLNHYANVLCPESVFFGLRHSSKLAWRTISLDNAKRELDKGSLVVGPLESGLYGGKTITVFNIQLAIWAGAKRIYLLGCDHNYVEPQYQSVKKVRHGEISNHFDPSYRKQDEVVNNAPVAQMNEAYAFTRRLADDYGVEIINLTPDTKLAAFEIGTIESATLKG